jgi:hypothetical protein
MDSNFVYASALASTRLNRKPVSNDMDTIGEHQKQQRPRTSTIRGTTTDERVPKYRTSVLLSDVSKKSFVRINDLLLDSIEIESRVSANADPSMNSTALGILKFFRADE